VLTHVTFEVSGEPSQLAAFDARVKQLCAEQQVSGEFEEQHAARRLHYDLKIEGGIPFPPFVLASGEFPELDIAVEWVRHDACTRGTARIVRGMLAEQNIENMGATGTGNTLSIRLKADGYLALAVVVLRSGRDEYRGYALTGRHDALFKIVRDAATGACDLVTTQGAAEWSRAWRVPPGREPDYRAIDPPQPIPPSDFSELEALAQAFVAGWIWLGNGPREEIAIEVERYQRLGYVVSDANLRASALHRIKDTAARDGGALHYTTLDAESAWVEEIIARCWPGANREGRDARPGREK
jgi:hypothetical protein